MATIHRTDTDPKPFFFARVDHCVVCKESIFSYMKNDIVNYHGYLLCPLCSMLFTQNKDAGYVHSILRMYINKEEEKERNENKK